MRLALRLAQRGQGFVEPNPMVGAVLVRNNVIIGQGWHQRFGGPHAEINALSKAIALPRGGTLYVTLEPCCHTGKTGPCTQALIHAGIKRVVVAMRDPNPLVRGKGIATLRKAGIQVDTGALQAEAQELNRPFTKWITTRTPYVIAKWAQTLDGCIADRNGKSQWISSPESRQRVHVIRGRVDGIMVGIGTALADDPMLTARPANAKHLRRTATRIVIDSQCRLPLNSKLVLTAVDVPTMVFHRASASGAVLRRALKLSQYGVECRGVRLEKNGALDLSAVLAELGKCNFTNILVEGGAKLMGAMLNAQLVDEGLVFIAPKIAGDEHARHAVEGVPLQSIQQAAAVTFTSCQRTGSDFLLHWRADAAWTPSA
jgi:diaminohydroxyphosphoribosylaminopyrimidine deaminase/5-amino-6-(5-phosphoribosylamino)uracil reductase